MHRGLRAWARPVLGAAALCLVASACAIPRPPQDDPTTGGAVPATAPSADRSGDPSAGPSASAGAAGTGGDVAGFDTVERSAVRVRNVECGSGIATGSGFAVDDHTFVTNQHVVAGARTLQVDTFDGQELSVRASSVSRIADLAVVHTLQALPAHVELADADPADATPVSVVGFPSGGPMTTSSGTVLGRIEDPLHTMTEQVLSTDAPVAPGSSGSAVLDAAGRVVGVVYAGATDGSRSFAVPVSVLRSQLGAQATAPAASTCG